MINQSIMDMTDIFPECVSAWLLAHPAVADPLAGFCIVMTPLLAVILRRQLFSLLD
ncbi:MAG: hypothetical protein PHI97_31285 [Desulfobulbus sp.]|nr:hypothetical protein [Desulfobulbus sp.]